MTIPANPVTDLTNLLETSGDGVHWSSDSEDLNANLVRLDPGHRIDDHVNDEVEVLIVMLAGSGTVNIDGEAHRLVPAVVALVRRSATRRITAGEHGMTYLSIHRRRRASGSAGHLPATGSSDTSGMF